MNNNLRRSVCVVFLGWAFLLLGWPQEKAPETEPLKKSAESFIRMDLLLVEKKPLPPPKRNIFTVGQEEVRGEISPEILQKRFEEMGIERDQNSQPQGENPAPSLNLRYLGYVLSGAKIVGLIVFEGEAMPVVEGDEISEGITVGRISPDEIEVFGPDSKPVKFSIEGEFP
jgi:hypothetical protein